MQVSHITVGVGLLLTLVLGCSDHQNSPATDLKTNHGHAAGDNQNSGGNNQELTTSGRFIALEGTSLTDVQKEELKEKGLIPSAYQLHQVKADGDCECRISVLGILANVLIDKHALSKRLPSAQEKARKRMQPKTLDLRLWSK